LLRTHINALAAAAALALASPSLATDAPTIKIGSFLSVTGPAAFLGDPEEGAPAEVQRHPEVIAAYLGAAPKKQRRCA
jgi:hypothetical protein